MLRGRRDVSSWAPLRQAFDRAVLGPLPRRPQGHCLPSSPVQPICRVGGSEAAHVRQASSSLGHRSRACVRTTGVDGAATHRLVLSGIRAKITNLSVSLRREESGNEPPRGCADAYAECRDLRKQTTTNSESGGPAGPPATTRTCDSAVVGQAVGSPGAVRGWASGEHDRFLPAAGVFGIEMNDRDGSAVGRAVAVPAPGTRLPSPRAEEASVRKTAGPPGHPVGLRNGLRDYDCSSSRRGSKSCSLSLASSSSRSLR